MNIHKFANKKDEACIRVYLLFVLLANLTFGIDMAKLYCLVYTLKEVRVKFRVKDTSFIYIYIDM